MTVLKDKLANKNNGYFEGQNARRKIDEYLGESFNFDVRKFMFVIFDVRKFRFVIFDVRKLMLSFSTFVNSCSWFSTFVNSQS